MLASGVPLSTAGLSSSSQLSRHTPLSLSSGYSIQPPPFDGAEPDGDQVATLNTATGTLALVCTGNGNNRLSTPTPSQHSSSGIAQALHVEEPQQEALAPVSRVVVRAETVSPAHSSSSWVTEADSILTPMPSSSSSPSGSRPRPLVISNSAANTNLPSRSTQSSQQLPPHPSNHPHSNHPHMFSFFPSSSSHSRSAPSDSGESSNGTATTLSASQSSVDSRTRMMQPRRRTVATTTTTATPNDVSADTVVPPTPSSVRFATHTATVATKVPSNSAASTSASVSSPPAGMGAAHPPQLERRISQVTSFSSFSSDEATAADKSGDVVAAQPLSSAASGSTPRRPSITTSKTALELLTKSRITSNLAIYKPRELWKPDAHAEKCDSPHCSKSFLLPFASSLASIPIPSLSSSLSSLSSLFSSSSTSSSLSSSSTHGGSSSYSSQSNALISSTSARSSSSSTQPITLLRSRHHCRMCGGVFCSECTAYKAALLDTRNTPWLFVPEGHDLLDVPVPGSSATSMTGTNGSGIGIGSTVVQGVRRASEGLVNGIRRRASQIVTSSSTATAATEDSEELASEDAGGDDTFPPAFGSSISTSSPIKRRKSSLAAVVSSYTATAPTTAALTSSTTAAATATSAPVPAYRTPQQHPASPSNPNPPMFSLPLHRASTSLAASALPESEPLVRVERICVGCAALLRGAAGKGRSAIPSLKSNANSSGAGGMLSPSSPVTPTFAVGPNVGGLSRTSSISSLVGLGGISGLSAVPGGHTDADAGIRGGESSFGNNEESERAREEIRAFRERLDSGASIASAPPAIAPNTLASSLSSRRRSRVRSAGSESTPGLIVGPSSSSMPPPPPPTEPNMRRNPSLSSLATASSSIGVGVRQSPPTPQHTFSPAVSSPLSPTPRSPRSSRFIISPSNPVQHQPLPPHGLGGLGLVGAGAGGGATDTVIAGGVNGNGAVLPKRTQSVLLPPSFLPAIPEPADDLPGYAMPQANGNGNGGAAAMVRKSALGGGVRPGMRRAHSSNEVDRVPRAANVATGSPLARASSLRAAGTTGNTSSKRQQQQKGRHVAWLPSSGSSFSSPSSASVESEKPSPLRTSSSPTSTSSSLVVASPSSQSATASFGAAAGASGTAMMALESGATSATVMDGASMPTVGAIATVPTVATEGAITPAPAVVTALAPSVGAKLKKARSPSPTSTLYGRPKPGQISLREVLQQTLGSDSDDEGEGDITISQNNVVALARSVSSATSSTSSRYSCEHEQEHVQVHISSAHDAAADEMAVVALGPAFPPSPPVQRYDKPVLYAPFGNGTAPALSLLTANTSRITTPSLPPSLLGPRESQPPTPTSTPPITRPPSTAELTKHANKSRADAYAAHERYQDELAVRRRLAANAAAVLPANEPFGFMAAAGIVGGVIAGAGGGVGVTAAYGNEKLFGGAPVYGREIGDEVRVAAPPTHTRRDLVKPLYAMTLSTF